MTSIRRRAHRVRVVGGFVVLALLTSACGSGGTADQEVVVSAAASLTDVFASLEGAFETQNPGIDVVLNLAGSSALRAQILEGAPADVFASADNANMDLVVAGGEAEAEPQLFARNRMQIAVPAGNPAGVAGLTDFAAEELLIGLCSEGVPCGDLARRILEEAGVTAVVDSNEPNVRALLTKIQVGELDAGLVYVTDVPSAGGEVDGVDIAGIDNVIAEYPIVVLRGSRNRDGAEAFVAFVLSDEGSAILREHGFSTP